MGKPSLTREEERSKSQNLISNLVRNAKQVEVPVSPAQGNMSSYDGQSWRWDA
jgi:hypothetical protein